MGGFRLGGYFDANSSIGPGNTGLNNYAQARLDNTISRAIAKHANSLSVDGIYFNLWTKTLGGTVCTCNENANARSLIDTIPAKSSNVNANNRNPIKSSDPYNIPAVTDSKFNMFRFTTNDQGAILSEESQINKPAATALDFNNAMDNSLDSLNRDLLLEQLSQPVDDDELARLVNSAGSGIVYGGDKTACGICFSTGHVNGYTLNGGMRVILDASFTNPFNLCNGAIVDKSAHPYKFILNSKGSVEWTADLTPYALQWLNFTVNNNLKPALGTQLQLFFSGAWQEITLGLLLQLQGRNTGGLYFRVIPDPTFNMSLDDTVEFTHAEISFTTTPPLLGQAPQLPKSLSFDYLEALINTNFELLAAVPSLPRESIMQDSRTNLLWKVTETTEKITARGQVFGFDVSVRKIATSEALYRLLLPLTLPTNYINQTPIGS
jgi:hypothetical protein